MTPRGARMMKIELEAVAENELIAIKRCLTKSASASGLRNN